MRFGDTVVIDGDLRLVSEIDGDMSFIIPFDGEMGVVTKVVEHDLPTYTGPTVVTPSNEQQVLETADHVVMNNIIVNPIPKNYGLITWDGVSLTVS